MSSEELHELQEHAEHAKHDPTLAPVSLTMAILAVLVAIVSLSTGYFASTTFLINSLSPRRIFSRTWSPGPYELMAKIRVSKSITGVSLTARISSST